MKEMKTYTLSEIYNIIDDEIKKEMDRKNRYIELNGFRCHVDTLKSFDSSIATLTRLYTAFK